MNSHYGVFYPPPEEYQDNYRIDFRLSLATNQQGASQDFNYHHEKYCFQTCSPGATQVDMSQAFLETRSGVETTIFGGRRRPLTINCEWLRHWLRLCETGHGDTCNRHLDTVTGDDAPETGIVDMIRFIDVQTLPVRSFKRVVLSSMKYIALSYVWGTKQKLTLHTDNVISLGNDGALKDRPASCTIMDAIDFTRQLGMRYIWVDALCIIQNDDVDKKNQLRLICDIYSYASATVVVAAGEDAEAGLPGLCPGTRGFEQEEVLVLGANGGQPAMSLMTTLNPRNHNNVHYLEDTKWNTRGWTFQERYLFRRVITFTSEQVYFACNTATFCEESYFEHGPPTLFPAEISGRELSLSIPRQHGEPQDDRERFWRRYELVIQRFSRRHLTFAGDVHDAFEGLQRGMTMISGEEWLWGLPRSILNAALTWSTFTGHTRRSVKSTLPMTEISRQVDFPSWSWMGWVGETWIPDANESREFDEAPTIDTYIHFNEQVGTAIRTVAAGSPETDDTRVQVKDVQTKLPYLFASVLHNTASGQILFFWAEIATFSLAREAKSSNAPEFPSKSTSMILNNSGTTIGNTGPMIRLCSADRKYDTSIWEFIRIYRRKLLEFEAVLTVLQVERRDDIMYRVNIGEIQEMAWQEADPTRVLIALG